MFLLANIRLDNFSCLSSSNIIKRCIEYVLVPGRVNVVCKYLILVDEFWGPRNELLHSTSHSFSTNTSIGKRRLRYTSYSHTLRGLIHTVEIILEPSSASQYHKSRSLHTGFKTYIFFDAGFKNNIASRGIIVIAANN